MADGQNLIKTVVESIPKKRGESLFSIDACFRFRTIVMNLDGKDDRRDVEVSEN